MFSNSQLKFINQILISLSQVFVASLVLDYFTKSVKLGYLILGIVLVLACWFTGLAIIKKNNL